MKQQVKRLGSVALRACDSGRRAWARLSRQPRPASWVVLYYHSVPAQDRERFARQLDRVLRLAQPRSIDAEQPLEPGRYYVTVTFDDGFVSVLENAAPELAERSIPWTMFVPSGCLGRHPEWLRFARPAARQDRVMNPEELRGLARDTRVSFGSHTVSHAHLVEAGPERAREELAESKSQLEGILGRTVDLFSYPFGARTAQTDELARGVGYRRLFSSSPSLVRQPAALVTGRVGVDPDTPWGELRLKVLGAYRWLARDSR